MIFIKNKNFIYNIINKDLKNKKYKNIITRFAPEPNGYLHIGHIKSIYLNYKISKDYKGKFYLRFDDTNPETSKNKYIKSIIKNIKWLGFNWNGKIKYASDYFELYYKYAKNLIINGWAYVDQLTKKEIKLTKGTLTTLGINSPYRNRTIEKNLELFNKMKNGVFKKGNICLRAKINMKSPNLILRDPVLYRIKYYIHHRTKNKWCIYPTYDFAHCIADSIEKISHSICTLEFINNNILYKWILKKINSKHIPTQCEFSKLNLTFNVTSKRKIKYLIKKKIIKKWNDPRLLTISGLKNRGYTPTIIINFCKSLGISKQENILDISILEKQLKKKLNKNLERRIAIINPIKIYILNIKNKYTFNILKHPLNPTLGTRKITLYSKIFIDKYDFKKIYNEKLNIKKKIKLKYAGILKIIKVKKNTNKKIVFIQCKYIKFNNFKRNNKLKIIHWISIKNSISTKFRLFNKLFNTKYINKKKNLIKNINLNSIIIKKGYIEKNIIKEKNKIFQFEREGYFKYNKKLSNKYKYIIFDRIIELSNNNKFK